MIISNEILTDKIKFSYRKIRMSSDDELKETTPPSSPAPESNLHENFISWKLNPTQRKFRTKQNTVGKLCKEVRKKELPPFDEENQLRILGYIIKAIKSRNYHQSESFSEIHYLLPLKNNYKEWWNFCETTTLSFLQICCNNTGESTEEDEEKIIIN